MHFRLPSLSFRLTRPSSAATATVLNDNTNDSDSDVIDIHLQHSDAQRDADELSVCSDIPSILLPLPPTGQTHRRAARSIAFDPTVDAYIECKARGYPRIPTFSIEPSPWEIVPARKPAHFSRSYHVIYERDGECVLQDEMYCSLMEMILPVDRPTLSTELAMAQELAVFSSNSSTTFDPHALGVNSAVFPSISMPALAPSHSQNSIVFLPTSISMPFKTSRLSSSFSTMDMSDLVEAVTGLSMSASLDSTGDFALGLIMSASGTCGSMSDGREGGTPRRLRTMSV